MANIHFRQDSNEWSTPQDLFDQLNKEFGFTIDVAASESNAKCRRFYSKDDDGLAQDWQREVVWMNPPFGHQIKLWMAKAYKSSIDGAIVVCLVPARTDTRWFHRSLMNAAEIRVLDKRLRFSGAKAKAPFPAVIAVFKPGDNGCQLRAYKVPGTKSQPITMPNTISAVQEASPCTA